MTAPGKPGIDPKWTSSAKTGVGTAIGKASDVWFTVSHGIVNEVYFPRIDAACTRDMGFIVTDGKEFFSEEKRHAVHTYKQIKEGVFAHLLTNTCDQQRYQIKKTVITDPNRDVLLQEVEITPFQGSLEDYHLYVLLAPHINNTGFKNTGWVGDYKGVPMLFAERKGTTLACAASTPFIGMNCGYAGTSDSWQDLYKNKKMTSFYTRAEDGNIALAAEINIKACNGKFVIALGFGESKDEAALQVRASLSYDFSSLCAEYVKSWEGVHEVCSGLYKVDEEGGKHFKTSISVLQCHKEKRISGANIASLSIPWGFDKGGDNLGGYHLIWPRDQVETAFAFLAADDQESARQTLRFLLCTQEADGHWKQCFWVDGRPYWEGVQLDEAAFPILLANALKGQNCLDPIHPFSMVAKASQFLVQNGPATKQDRWEEEEGYTPFTLSIEIAALLAAADFFEDNQKQEAANYLRTVADFWNEKIEDWLYVKETPLAKELGIEGYYVRVAPAEICENLKAHSQVIKIKNRPDGEREYLFSEIISIDALALVRFGLRKGDDPKIMNTVKAIDHLLKTSTKKGPIWHRYNEDGYGEHHDGTPYDGTGIGRGWPLLIGERAHYEIAKGDRKKALEYLKVMSKMAGEGGLFPEQVWDAEDIPEKRLYNGHSTGSAKPLVWAHAEYITLLRSLKDGKIFGQPQQTVNRYVENKIKATHAIWREDHKTPAISYGKILRIQTEKPETILYQIDGKSSQEIETVEVRDLNLHYVDLPTKYTKNKIQFKINGKVFAVEVL